MPTFYKPGTRRGNKTFTVRGSIDGQRHELRCEKARTVTAAREEWDDYRRQVREDCRLEQATFGELMDAYIESRSPATSDRRYLDRLRNAWVKSRKAKLGQIQAVEVTPHHIAQAANVLYPGKKEATKNRQAYGPAAAVLHYGAKCELIPWRRVEKLREPEPETRRPLSGTAQALLSAAEGLQRELLLFLFLQGWRITESLAQDWENTDLKARTFRVYVSKARRWKTIHMHPEVFLALAQRPQDEGPLWPWRDRRQVYEWLKPLCKKVGATFTPHMARHEWGSQQREAGGSPRDAVMGNTWTSEKSVARYEAPSAEHGQKIAARVKIGAKEGQEDAKLLKEKKG